MDEGLARGALAASEREQLAVYARIGAPVGGGAWVLLGLAVWVLMASQDLGSPVASFLGAAVFGVLLGGVIGRAKSRRGAGLRFRAMPPVLRRPFIVLAAVLVVFCVGGGVAAALALDVPYRFTLHGAACGVVVALGGWLATRVYETRAKRLAERTGRTT